jgi:hypothetical protein
MVLFGSPAGAQNAPLKLQLAQQFEDNGEWENAQPLYEELFHSDSTSYIYYEGLQCAIKKIHTGSCYNPALDNAASERR